jgi:hypothetical protein
LGLGNGHGDQIRNRPGHVGARRRRGDGIGDEGGRVEKCESSPGWRMRREPCARRICQFAVEPSGRMISCLLTLLCAGFSSFADGLRTAAAEPFLRSGRAHAHCRRRRTGKEHTDHKQDVYRRGKPHRNGLAARHGQRLSKIESEDTKWPIAPVTTALRPDGHAILWRPLPARVWDRPLGSTEVWRIWKWPTN